MQKTKFYLSFLLIFLFFNAFAQKKTIIPFQLTEYNNISIQAIINQKDTVNLMFHTAANSVNLTEATLQKISSIKFDRTDSIKSWGGNGNTSRFSQSNTIQIGALKWDVPIWEDKNSGQKTDGKFGLNLFANKVVEIDFDKKIIILYANLPNKVKRYKKLKLTYKNEMMFIEADCEIGNSTYKNDFLIHSGYPGTILLDDQFISENKIAEKLKVIDEKSLKDSFGNVLKTKKAILPKFTIGNEQLANIPVGFFEGALGRQKMSIIGGDILKRYNIIIDAKRTYIYLKTNSLGKLGYSNS